MRPKVLFLTRWYPNRVDKLDGNFIENHARAVALYCDLAVLYVGADPNMSDRKFDSEESTEFGIPIVRVWYRNNDVPKEGFGRVIKFFRYLKATRVGWKLMRNRWGVPQVSHVHIFTRPVLLAFYLRWKYGTPFIFTEHSSHFVHELPKWLPPKKQFAQIAARSAEYITVVSKALQKAISGFGLKGNYAIVPNVVFVPETKPIPPGNDKVSIVAIGGLSDSRKNVAGLIEAFHEVSERIPRAQLHIVSPIGEEFLHAKAKDTGLLNHKIFFYNYLSNEEVYDLLMRSSFLVVNSLSETFSMSAAEALACGKPVISTRCGGPEEFLDEERGLLIDVKNPEQLRAALLWMYEHHRDFNPEALKSFVRENFSMEVVGRKFLDLYQQVLKQ